MNAESVIFTVPPAKPRKPLKCAKVLYDDGTGLIIDSTVAYSLNPANEKTCLEFILKHGKPFMDAKKAGKEYIPDYE